MRLIIDEGTRSLTIEEGSESRSINLYTSEAFEILSRQWLRVGWDQKHPYTFTWLGRPIIQLPEDLLRIQEVIYRVKPDVIVETGVAHGGSLVFYASLCTAINKGRIIGIDIDIRPANRRSIESHELHRLITLIECSSTDPATLAAVNARIQPGESVLVILDSCHTMEHVTRELEMYAPLVTPGSYIVATDGIMREVHDVPRAGEGWANDNPTEAAREFARHHPEFEHAQPTWLFNESPLKCPVTHWPEAYLRRRP